MRVAIISAGLAAALVAVAGCGDGGTGRVSSTLPLGPRPASPAVRVHGSSERPHAAEARAVQLGLPDPSHFRPGGAERAAAEFMQAWHDRAWSRMASWTAAAWVEQHASAASDLRKRFRGRRLLGWELVRSRLHPRRALATVTVAFRDLRPRVRRQRLRLRLWRETRDGRLAVPASSGHWGVDPLFSHRLTDSG